MVKFELFYKAGGKGKEFRDKGDKSIRQILKQVDDLLVNSRGDE